MLSKAPPICFIATGNPSASREFYSSVLGLTCLMDRGGELLFELQGTVLRIQYEPGFKAAGHTVHGWRVNDLDAVMSDLSSKGVQFLDLPCFEQDSRLVLSQGAMRIAWFADPDGNMICLSEKN